MTIFQKMMYVILSVTVVCAVSTANLVFADSSSRIPQSEKTEVFLERYFDNERTILKSLFPYEEPDFLLEVPSNMSYTTREFQQFIGTYLTERESVEAESYLSKICFCGDSLTYHMGMRSDRPLYNYDVLAYGGLTVTDWPTYTKAPIYNQSDEIKTALQWLSILKPEIIYIMLGTNGMVKPAIDTHIALYSDLITKIETASPSSIIVLCSVAPWGKSAPKYASDTSVVNEKIRFFNMKLLELAKERGCYFLNGAEEMTDEDGYLKAEYADGDGLHWVNEGREAYISYVLSHPIPGY